jgi:receptor protein-tyrosine kinase
VIIFNTPPLLAHVDAQLVAVRAGAALLVAQDDVTRMADLAAAQRRLKEAEVTVLGACLLGK